MKILGISGSARTPELSGTYKLVKTILEACGHEYDIISLRGKKIGGCTACLGCVKDNVCKQHDDMESLRDKIIEADAYVIGSPNYFSTINAMTHALLERLYQFRHREADLLWGKLAIAVGVGGTSGTCCCDEIEKFMSYSFIETIAKVSAQGAPSCYICGYGETCKVGALVMVHGEGYKIRKEDIPDVSKQPEAVKAAVEAGKLMAQRLSKGHNRKDVALKMQKLMMEKFKEST